MKEAIKGDISASEIVLKEPGGETADRGTIFFGSPNFTAGEDVVICLDTWPDGSLRVHDMCFGKFTIVRDQQTRQLIVVRDLAGSQVQIIAPSPRLAEGLDAGETTSRMELSAYLRMIRRKLAANLEEWKRFQDTYYRGTRLIPQPADYPDIASRRASVQFHLWGPPACWFEPNMGQPVTFMVNPVGATNPRG